MYEVEHILVSNNILGEGPLWSVEEQALYWIDIDGRSLHSFKPESKQFKSFGLGGRPGVAVFREKGGFAMAIESGFAFWSFENPHLEWIAKPEEKRPEARFNDGVVDRGGRFWAGSMSDQPTNHLFRLDADHSLHLMEKDITVSNGISWSPDNKTMYYTDSPRLVIYAYDFDAETGNIANRRVFARVPDGEGFPDGLAVDVDGFVWSANWDGWRITRYDPQGKIALKLPMPVQRPTSCAFGGKNLDELYITSAKIDLTPAQLEKQPYAGHIFRVKVGVKGFPPTKYAG